MVKGVFLQFLLPPHSTFFTPLHCVEIIQIQNFFWSVFSSIRTEYGPEKTPYLDTFHTLKMHPLFIIHTKSFLVESEILHFVSVHYRYNPEVATEDVL